MSRVLIVEDDKDIADLIAHYLRKAGHAVETLGSGALVMPRVSSARPDLIVLDLRP
jgi:two-component system, OmpR family, response regulator ResD